MGHGHDHHHAGQHAGHGNERRTFAAACVVGSFMVVEAVGGWLTGSLALLADAGHMLTDTAALALAWFGFRIARRPADRTRTYGFGRVRVLVAFVNGLTLLAICAWIVVEAIGRLADPVEVLGGWMLAVAGVGLLVNVAAFVLLHGAERDNLNIRGALLHVVGDLLGSVAAIAAALVILLTGWTPIDPLLSLLVAGLIVVSAVRLVRRSGHILLEGAPAHLDVEEIRRDLEGTIPEIENVHHLHAWSVAEDTPMVTLHARTTADVAPDLITRRVRERLAERFRVDHVTVQVEHAACAGPVSRLTG
jgi:cobalt-zinc-cadmium efflux system protein